jgi:hypothetical protein
MTHKTIQKTLPILLLTLSLVLPTTAMPLTQKQNTQEINQDPTSHTLNIEEQEQILKEITNKNKSRYITISAGIRATSFFLKIPKLLTQRGIAFIAEIKYRSPLAFTLVLERSQQNGISTYAFERGTHRLIVIGFGHAAFTRPHVGSFGRYIGFSSTKPIVF